MNETNIALRLDPITAEKIDVLAKVWGVSREDAVIRAITEAKTIRAKNRLAAVKELRDSLKLTPSKAQDWKETIREARR